MGNSQYSILILRRRFEIEECHNSMLINVNAYILMLWRHTKWICSSKHFVTGVGYGQLREAAPNSISGQRMALTAHEFSGWSTDRNNISTTKVTTVNVTQDTTVYGQWTFKEADSTSSATITPALRKF